MAALTADRHTPMREGTFVEPDVAASTMIYAGAMVALDASGNAVPASDAAGLVVIGRAEDLVDNSAGDAGDLTVRVRIGVFGFAASGTNAPAAANVGDLVYVEDDQTVSTDGGTNSIVAGKLVDVDSDYCWVDTGAFGVARIAANQADSTAEDVAGVVSDFNDLLAALQTAGLMASA